jgi:lipoprotein-releasing system permease protein
MIESASSSVEATMKGIDATAERTTSDLAANIIDGSLDLLEDGDEPGYGMVIGSGVAEKLQVTLGDRVALVSMVQDAASEWPIPRRQVFEVTGIFEYGMHEYDTNLIYTSFRAVQKYLDRPDVVSGLEIKVDDIFRAKTVAEAMQRDMGLGYRFVDWSEANKNLFALYGLYKKLMFVMLIIIVLVACLNVASTLIMMVMEKNRDIAILKSMGASSASIRKLFVLQGVFIGIVGTALGCLLGGVVCWVADTYHIIQLEGGVYFLNYLPFKMTPFDVVLVAAASILICFLSTLYPAKQAARLDPAVALRCE